jgi:hypothetical protein
MKVRVDMTIRDEDGNIIHEELNREFLSSSEYDVDDRYSLESLNLVYKFLYPKNKIKINDSEKERLLELLATKPKEFLALAYLYAENYLKYGEDVTEKWDTATRQSSILATAYHQGQHDLMEELSKDDGRPKE